MFVVKEGREEITRDVKPPRSCFRQPLPPGSWDKQVPLHQSYLPLTCPWENVIQETSLAR